MSVNVVVVFGSHSRLASRSLSVNDEGRRHKIQILKQRSHHLSLVFNCAAALHSGWLRC